MRYNTDPYLKQRIEEALKRYNQLDLEMRSLIKDSTDVMISMENLAAALQNMVKKLEES
jgi:putative methionine-R-sulfoxide reductase with GAF domain